MAVNLGHGDAPSRWHRQPVKKGLKSHLKKCVERSGVRGRYKRGEGISCMSFHACTLFSSSFFVMTEKKGEMDREKKKE